MNRLRVGAPRAALFLGLGGALVATTALPGCRSDSGDARPTADTPAQPERGVVTKVSEVAPGRFVIDDESVVDGPTRVQVQHLDGTTKTLDSPDAFARLLAPVDTIRAYDARTSAYTSPASGAPTAPDGAPSPTTAASGGGGSWDTGTAPEIGDAPRSADGTSWAVPAAAVGLPLGVLLAQTMAMPLWHPPTHASLTSKGATPLAYRSPAVRDSSRRRGGLIAGMILLGRMPFGGRQAALRSSTYGTGTRATTPSRGRTGFGRGWSGSGGG